MIDQTVQDGPGIRACVRVRPGLTSTPRRSPTPPAAFREVTHSISRRGSRLSSAVDTASYGRLAAVTRTWRIVLLAGLLAAPFALVGGAAATSPGHPGLIYFISDSKIFSMLPDGSDVRQITFSERFGVAIPSPTGQQLAVSEQSPSGHSLPYVMNADGSDLSPLADPSIVNALPGGWSPDGR